MGTRSSPSSTTARAPTTSLPRQGKSGRGERLWGGAAESAWHGQRFVGNPKITATSDGFVVVGWIDGNNLSFQRVRRRRGAALGPGSQSLRRTGLTYSLADLHGGDNGSAIFLLCLATADLPDRSICSRTSSVRRGDLLWGNDHVRSFDGGSLQFGNFPPFVTDGAGGAVFGWYEVDPLQSRAQHILADGSEAFPHNGTPARIDTSARPGKPKRLL